MHLLVFDRKLILAINAVGLIKTLIKMYKTEFLNSSTCSALIKRASETNFTHNMDIISQILWQKIIVFQFGNTEYFN